MTSAQPSNAAAAAPARGHSTNEQRTNTSQPADCTHTRTPQQIALYTTVGKILTAKAVAADKTITKALKSGRLDSLAGAMHTVAEFEKLADEAEASKCGCEGNGRRNAKRQRRRERDRQRKEEEGKRDAVVEEEEEGVRVMG